MAYRVYYTVVVAKSSVRSCTKRLRTVQAIFSQNSDYCCNPRNSFIPLYLPKVYRVNVSYFLTSEMDLNLDVNSTYIKWRCVLQLQTQTRHRPSGVGWKTASYSTIFLFVQGLPARRPLFPAHSRIIAGAGLVCSVRCTAKRILHQRHSPEGPSVTTQVVLTVVKFYERTQSARYDRRRRINRGTRRLKRARILS